MVPPNWQHPTNDRGHLQPMHNERFEDRFARWLADFDRIRGGNLTDLERECYPMHPLAEWLCDEGQPHDPAYYRPWRDEEATWFQVWETVTEGTPVTPAFATREELVDHLVEHGDRPNALAHQRSGYSREVAEAFVKAGWAPSMVMLGNKTASGIEVPHLIQSTKQ